MKTSHIEFLIEEPSMEACLQNLLPKLLAEEITFQIHVFQGKRALLDNLGNRLRGYAKWLPRSFRIIIVVDCDDNECHELKRQLEKLVSDTGLMLGARSRRSWQVLIRIAIEELEAWLLGDMEAIRTVYPRVSATAEKKATYRDPDSIRGGTWEALERLLKNAGYFKSGLRKVEAARAISIHLVPERNRSHSFQVFRSALSEIIPS